MCKAPSQGALLKHAESAPLNVFIQAVFDSKERYSGMLTLHSARSFQAEFDSGDP